MKSGEVSEEDGVERAGRTLESFHRTGPLAIIGRSRMRRQGELPRVLAGGYLPELASSPATRQVAGSRRHDAK